MKYEEQERKIYAKYDDKTIRVYQAYNNVIASEAIKLGTFGELSLEEFKIQCPLNIIENPMYIKKSLEEAIKAKDENDFERLHTIV